MNTFQIFSKYFKSKLIIWGLIFVLIFFYRLYEDKTVKIEATLIVLGIFILNILVLGFMDYWFYEKRLNKLILELLNKPPLNGFIDKSFILEDDSKLSGEINEYKIILAPSANSNYKKYLTILIPIELRDDLEKYFVKFDDHFKVTLSSNVLFTQAVIENYTKLFDCEKLYNTIYTTTQLLKERGIKPVIIADDQVI